MNTCPSNTLLTSVRCNTGKNVRIRYLASKNVRIGFLTVQTQPNVSRHCAVVLANKNVKIRCLDDLDLATGH